MPNKLSTKSLIVLLLLLISPSVFAMTSIFDIPTNDQSMLYLTYIFGNVGDVLAGSENAPLKIVLVYFNNAVLVLGGIIIIYSSTVGTINMAHEGEMLGKNWNSVWIPLRASFGFALLLPVKANGYALIQVFFMWVITQGIGAADYIWSQGVSAIQSGTAYVSATMPDTNTYLAAQSAFTSQVCTIKAGELYLTSSNITKASDKYNYGVTSMNPNDICGTLTASVSPTDPNYAAVSQALTNFNDSLMDAAQNFVRDYDTAPLNEHQTNLIQKQIQDAVTNYTAAMQSIQSQQSQTISKQSQTLLDQAKKTGWIAAGMYYFTLSQAQNAVTKNIYIPTTSPYINQASTLQSYLGPSNYTILDTTLQAAMEISTTDKINFQSPSEAANVFMDELGPMAKGFSAMVNGLTSGMSGGPDPMLQISSFGGTLAASCIVAWLGFTAVMMVLAGVSGIASFISPGFLIFQTSMAFILAPLLVSVGALVVQGLIMEFYIPMIPYIIFSLAAVGWLILVIEAMIAAPLVAIGVIHPEGQHQMFGRSETGLMIMVSVFLRPSLMILGLFASIALSRVAITIISVGFGPVSAQILAGQGGFSSVMTFLPGFATVIGIYVAIIMVMYNRVFSLIYLVPDRIMRWIGHAPEQTSIEQEVQAAKGGAQEGAGTTQKAGEAAGQELMSYKKQKASIKAQQDSRRGTGDSDQV